MLCHGCWFRNSTCLIQATQQGGGSPRLCANHLPPSLNRLFCLRAWPANFDLHWECEHSFHPASGFSPARWARCRRPWGTCHPTACGPCGAWPCSALPVFHSALRPLTFPFPEAAAVQGVSCLRSSASLTSPIACVP